MGKAEKIPEGYRVTEAGILPVDWQVKRLSEVATELTERAGQDKYETVSISAGVGFVNQAEKFGKELSGKQYEKYIVLHQGDFSYNKGNSKTFPQGCIYRLNDRETAAVPNVFESFRIEDQDADYYEQLFLIGFLNKQLYSKINRGVRDDGLLNLTGKDFYSCMVPVPPIAEQKKIAEILAQCDKVIELKRQRIEEEKNKKKWILEETMKMPKGILGSSNKYTGTLEDLVSKIETGTSVNSIDDVNSTIDSNHKFVLKTSAICDGVFIETECKKVVPEDYNRTSCSVESGTLLVSRMNTPKLVGACAVCYKSLPNVYLPDRLWKVSVKAMVDPRWLNYILNSAQYKNLIQERAGGTSNSMKNISQKDFLRLPISPPPYEKQVIIGDTLSSIDNLIQKLEEEVDAWMQKKKLMMQLLLTGIVRVKL